MDTVLIDITITLGNIIWGIGVYLALAFPAFAVVFYIEFYKGLSGRERKRRMSESSFPLKLLKGFFLTAPIWPVALVQTVIDHYQSKRALARDARRRTLKVPNAS